MITLTPDSTSLDVNHVMAILTLVTDPVATKARLIELNDMVEQANAAAARAQSMQSDATQRMSVYESGAANLAADKAAFASLTKEVTDRQNATDAALVARKTDLDAREAKLTATLDQREKNVTQREMDVGAREAAIAAAGDQAVALKAEYEDKLAKLRDITGAK